jgi:hypothetical protein
MKAPVAPLLLLLTACGPKLEVPPELEEDAEALPIEGRAADPFTMAELRVGPYVAHKIQRGFASQLVTDTRFGPASLDLATFPQNESFSFVLQAAQGGSDWPSVCTTTQGEKAGGIALGPLGSAANHLTCICGDPSAKTAWRLEMMTDDKGPRGLYISGEKSFRVASSHVPDQANRKRKIMTGYLVSSRDQHLAAIDIADGGSLWLARSLAKADRDAIACAAVALLLREPVK